MAKQTPDASAKRERSSTAPEDAQFRGGNSYNRSLIEASPDPLVTISPEGKISDVNAATVRITGYSSEELVGTNFSDYFTEPEKAAEGYETVFRKGIVRDFPLEIRHRNGGVTPVLYNASVYLDESGTVAGVFAAARDVTELRRAEKELVRAGAYNRSLIEASLDPLVTISPDGKIMDVNAATVKITGYPRKKLIGTDFTDYFTNRGAAKAGYDTAFKKGSVRDYELEIRHKSGKTIPVLYNASVYRDAEGDVAGIFAAARDVTRLKKAEEDLKEKNTDLEAALEEVTATEEELRQSFEELATGQQALQKSEAMLRSASIYNRSLIEASLDPLVTISPGGKITDINEATARVTGFSREELIGTDFSRYFTEPDRAKAGYEKVFRDGSVTDYELRILHREGTVQDYPLELRNAGGKITPALYNASVFRDEQGIVNGVFAAARDITGQKRAEESLRTERQRLYDVLETLPVYVCLLDKDYHMPFANRYFRETFGESHGKRCYEFLFNLDKPCENCDTYTVMKTRAPHYWYWTGPNGRDYDIYDYPFTDSDGSFNILEMGIDITEQKRAEAALQKAHDELEERVGQRTAELGQRNEELGALNEELTATQEELRKNIEDLGEREKDLNRVLAEKEILLSEIHHRVKNNLTAFISLLSLEGSIEDTPAGKTLKQDLQNRARSMSLIHETLYRTKIYDEVDMGLYLTTLLDYIGNSFRTPRAVKTIVHAHGVMLDISRATPAGLIVNELVTNSFKYAFAESVTAGSVPADPPTLTVALAKNNGEYRMTVKDNGPGLPPGFDPVKTQTLGLKLVNFLARHQMRAKVEVNTEKGTEFVFRFKE
jgi:PAS domain S-box-containing protein